MSLVWTIRKQTGQQYDKKLNNYIPTYKSHFVMFLNTLELNYNNRTKNDHVQCIRCKEYFKGSTIEKSLNMLNYHYKHDDCVERTSVYTVPKDRQLRYT